MRNSSGKSLEIANRVRVPTECTYKFSDNFGQLFEQISEGIGTVLANAIETAQIPAQILPCESVGLLLIN